MCVCVFVCVICVEGVACARRAMHNGELSTAHAAN